MAAAQPLKIRMVAGLGNPGEEYAETRHNAGFKAIDELARQAGVTYWKNQAGAEVALININDPEEEGGKRQIVLVKPQSYMNTSGGPISKLCREYKIKAEELLVIHDELDIPAGDVRVKVGGRPCRSQRPAFHHRQDGQPRLQPHPHRHRQPSRQDGRRRLRS